MSKYKIIPSTDNIQNPYEFNYFSTYCPENVRCSAREIQKSEGDFLSICALFLAVIMKLNYNCVDLSKEVTILKVAKMYAVSAELLNEETTISYMWDCPYCYYTNEGYQVDNDIHDGDEIMYIVPCLECGKKAIVNNEDPIEVIDLDAPYRD